MRFWETIKNSVYSPEFYRTLRGKNLSFSLKYFFSFAAVVAVVTASVVSFRIIPQAQFAFTVLGTKVTSYFPEELEIVIAEGEASVNVAEPYLVKTPDDFLQSTSTAKYENLFVADTVSPLSVDVFRSYSTLVLLTKHDFMVSGNHGEVRVYPLEGIPDMKINKKSVTNFVGDFMPLLKFLGPIIAILSFLFFMGYASVQLIYLFFGALLVWALLWLKGIKVGYREAYRTGIHAMTLGVLVYSLSFIIPMHIAVPFLFTILMLIVVAVNCKKEEGEHTELSEMPPVSSAS
ncbi:MAG: DUF1189 domain-containing protein [Patescibacteria group bacterium]|nr:DUF1189 domain-containing protein [Patescibacteria group bacterium]